MMFRSKQIYLQNPPQTIVYIRCGESVYCNSPEFMQKSCNMSQSSTKDLSHNLLIIGAGAHKPYNFPTSADIKEKLKEILKAGKIILLSNSVTFQQKTDAFMEKYHLCREIKSAGIVPCPENAVNNAYDIVVGEYVDNFLRSFTGSSATSIDSYLAQLTKSESIEKKTIYPKLGKFIIAYLISKTENLEPLGCQPSDWIQFLIKEYIEPDPESFFKNPPKIVTFNYDRLFERYLYEHLTEFHHMHASKAEELISSMDVVHVYGNLGCFTKWNDVSTSFYSQASAQIKVIGEDRDESSLAETKKTIQKYIVQSNKIYFIGYGFDPLNNDIIFKDLEESWRKGKLIVSTNIGITTRDRARIHEQLGFQPSFIDKVDHLGKVNCLDLLQEKVPLEFKFTQSEPKKIIKRNNSSWLHSHLRDRDYF